MALNRVVVTGLGVTSPLGVGVGALWDRVIAGKCAVSALDCINTPQYAKLPCRVAAAVPQDLSKDEHAFDWSKFTTSEKRQISRATAFAKITAIEAWHDAKLEENVDRDRVGVAVGMGVVDLDDVHQTGSFLEQEKYSRVSPYFVPRILTNSAAGYISIQFGLRGPNHSASTACTTGLHGIGDAFNMIRLGMADVMLCGGTEACISPISVAGFSRCRALSTNFNDRPAQASRPFDKDRDGFVMGEGCAILVLEKLEHALARSARIYAEVLGYGMSGDGFHLTSPDPQGTGAYLCMRRAVDTAKVSLKDVGYINCHATSTPMGDKIEIAAICRLAEEYAHSKDYCITVSSNKGAIGHLLGAAGAVEFVITVLSLVHKKIPHTVNLECCDFEVPKFIDVITEPKEWQSDGRKIALKNSFGFGGTNASIVVADYIQ